MKKDIGPDTGRLAFGNGKEGSGIIDAQISVL